MIDKITDFKYGIQDDYNYCINNDAFISCRHLYDLDEAIWDNENDNKYRHYIKHVCGRDEKYTGSTLSYNKKENNFERIKFPNMSMWNYLTRAEQLADYTPAKKELTNSDVFGWKANIGWLQTLACIKFKLSNLKSDKGQPLYEYVAYIPIYGDEKTKVLDNDISYKYNTIKDRLVFSYGLTSNPIDNFKKLDTLPVDDLDESLNLVKITESILTEANRQQLLQKSRNAQEYSPKNRLKGKNRYDRRTKSSISATVRDYNMIQMDPLFKRDILEFKIPVMGETDVYTVDVRVDGLLAEIRKQIMANKGTLEFKVILQSLMKVLNVGNVYIGCSCPDAKYRMAYQQTKNDYKAGYRETRPSDKTNPNDTLGAGCKHVLLVLANLDWAVKVASVINNYIKYCKEHLQRNYADYIFPKIYGVKYDKAVQLQLFDNGLFPEDIETMNTVIDQGFRGKDKQGKFVKNNEFRFQKTDNKPEQEEDNPLGLDMSSPSPTTDEEEPEEQ